MSRNARRHSPHELKKAELPDPTEATREPSQTFGGTLNRLVELRYSANSLFQEQLKRTSHFL